MSHHCEACGKELNNDARYCEECIATLTLMGEAPEPEQKEPEVEKVAAAPAAKSTTDPSAGKGQAVAALIFGILAALITVLATLIMRAVAHELLDALIQEMDESPSMDQGAASIFKFVFTAMHFAYGGIFMLLGFIFSLVAIGKCAGNKNPRKSNAPLVIGLIALVLVIVAVVFAISGSVHFSKLIDTLVIV